MLAVLLHILIVAFLVFGFDWSKIRKPTTQNANVVQAHTVDAKQLDQAKEKGQAVQQEKQRIEALKRKQAEEKKRQEQQEQKRIAKEKAEQQKQEVERQRQAKLKKEREAKEAKRKAEEKRLAALEAKRKAEAEAEAKRKAEAEVKRKAELERKRKAELEAKRKAEARRKAEAAAQAERERALQKQLAAEQNNREIDRYKVAIQQQIQRKWLKPGFSTKGLSCVIRVRLIPGGEVLPGGVSIIKSSGNATFDRSVETAVYKSAPFQVPSGPLFEEFRTLDLNFNPD
jgi:colicin import membrane protein